MRESFSEIKQFKESATKRSRYALCAAQLACSAHKSACSRRFIFVQMGGPEGVRAAEASRITVAPRDGMWMHAVPRC